MEVTEIKERVYHAEGIEYQFNERNGKRYVKWLGQYTAGENWCRGLTTSFLNGSGYCFHLDSIRVNYDENGNPSFSSGEAVKPFKDLLDNPQKITIDTLFDQDQRFVRTDSIDELLEYIKKRAENPLPQDIGGTRVVFENVTHDLDLDFYNVDKIKHYCGPILDQIQSGQYKGRNFWQFSEALFIIKPEDVIKELETINAICKKNLVTFEWI